ncbi:5655_t:CDS:2, partial [Gigaspora margarita]
HLQEETSSSPNSRLLTLSATSKYTTMTEATIEDVIILVRHNMGKDSDNQSLEITESVEDQAILEKLGQILDIMKIEFLHKNFYIEKAGEINSYEA